MTDRECLERIFLLRDACLYDDSTVPFLDRAEDLLRQHVAKETERLTIREQKLRAACAKAQMSVMETSGEWRLFDTSARGKELDAQSLEIARKNVDLELEIDKLKKEVALLKSSTSDGMEGTEYCCECGADYPRAELVRDGEIYCPKCREKEKDNGT